MPTQQVTEVELSAGVLEYQDTGGAGPVVVLLHGLAMNGSVWRHVVADLAVDHRCVLPTLPLGGHRLPMRQDADLSLAGIAGLIGEFLDVLGLDNVILVGNDWGGAQLLADHPRVGRLVLVACEAFDNYPPGLPGQLVRALAKVPGGYRLLGWIMGLRTLRAMGVGFGSMSKHGLPDDVVAGWLRPLRTNRAVRRDLARYAGPARRREMVEATERLREFDRPALVVWAPEDKMMPAAHGRRLAELLPKGQLVEIRDTYTLIPEDQPAELATAIRSFVRDSA
jgi:pimeloyl-ACP methyl ester carboxylesterase